MSSQLEPRQDWWTELCGVDLVDWYKSHGRDLPWRHSRDPWAVLVAEVMLQQTHVDRVMARWGGFVSDLPDARTCAAAGRAEIVARWHGMGFNRRAVNLHRAAEQIVAEHGGAVPDDLTALLALPGVGAYTARAVRVFSFELVDAVLDTNVARVLARSAGARLTQGAAQAAADAIVDREHPWAWNQAMLDVGAMHCRPNPECEGCPFFAVCAWAGSGYVEPDPSIRSAGVSAPQSRFEGSDRQGRGRLVDALRRGPVEPGDLAAAMGWPDDPDRAQRVAGRVIADGLATRRDDGSYALA